MKSFDTWIMLFFNQLAQISYAFDRGVFLLSANELLKGGVFMAIMWWGWFAKDKFDEMIANRKIVIATFISSGLVMMVTRGLALILTFRDRPIYNESLGLKPTLGFPSEIAHGWSSFPSDHAALFFTLVIGVFLLSKWLGILAFFYCTFFIMVPRLYLGLHYPSDILAGMVLAILISSLVHNLRFKMLMESIYRWENNFTAIFYAAFFLVCFQGAVLFNHLRSIVSFCVSIMG